MHVGLDLEGRRAEFRKVIRLMKFYERRCRTVHTLLEDHDASTTYHAIKEARRKLDYGEYYFISPKEEVAVGDAITGLETRLFKDCNGVIVYRKDGSVIG